MLEDERRRQAEAQSDHERPPIDEHELELAVAVAIFDPLAGKTVNLSWNGREPLLELA